MYLYLGPGAVTAYGDIVGIFDLDNTTQSHRTRTFLERAERSGQLTAVGDDIPKSFVVCAPKKDSGQKVWVVQPAPATLRGRMEQNALFDRRP